MKIRKLAVAACIATLVLVATFTYVMTDALATWQDPYGGTPQCTDAIADAGGICHGEPTSAGLPAPAPGPETTPETWAAGTPETQVFEDGSWVAADGTSGCTPGAPCDLYTTIRPAE